MTTITRRNTPLGAPPPIAPGHQARGELPEASARGFEVKHSVVLARP